MKNEQSLTLKMQVESRSTRSEQSFKRQTTNAAHLIASHFRRRRRERTIWRNALVHFLIGSLLISISLASHLDTAPFNDGTKDGGILQCGDVKVGETITGYVYFNLDLTDAGHLVTFGMQSKACMRTNIAIDMFIYFDCLLIYCI